MNRVLVLSVIYLNFVLSYPNHGTEQTDQKSENPLATLLIGSEPVNCDSPEFARLLFSCVAEEVWSVAISCQEETASSLNMSEPTATTIGLSREHSIHGLNDYKSDEFHGEEGEMNKVVSDCILKKTGTVDEVTGQFDIDSYAEMFKSTSLTPEQKSSTIASFKSCITANQNAPSFPIFVRWNETANETTADANDNFMCASQIIRCDMISLIQNGCSDTSISNSTLAWLLHKIQGIGQNHK